MAGISREVLYQDADAGIVVTVERQAGPDQSHRANEAEMTRQRVRQQTLVRLRQVLNRARTDLEALPEPAGAEPLPNTSESDDEAALTDAVGALVYLKIRPAPGGSETRPVDLANFFVLVAGIVQEETGRGIACEIQATSAAITFQIGLPGELAAIVRQQLYAAYPLAVIELMPIAPVQIDLQRTAGAILTFTPEDKPLRLAPDQSGDPLHALLEVLGGLQPGQTAWIQLVVSSVDPHHSFLRRAASFWGETLRERFQPTSETIAEADGKADEAIARGNLRILVTAPAGAAAKTLLNQLVAPFHQWTAAGGAQVSRSLPRLTRLAAAMRTLQPDSQKSFLLTAAELASLYHLPAQPRAFPRLDALSSTQLAPPRQERSTRGLYLGRSRYRNQLRPVIVADEDRLRHLYLIGQTGTGKSTLFQSLFLQDVLAGEGCCFIDPHGEAIDWLLARLPKNRLQDVILFDPSHQEMLLGLNLLQWRTPDERDLLIQELILLFYKLFDPEHSGIIGPQFEHWLRSAALTVTEPTIRGTLADIPRLFTDQAYQRWATSRLRHPAAKSFWQEQMTQTASFHKSEMLNYFVSKFGAFLGNATMRQILGQRQSAFDIRTLMDRRKILLVNLSKGKIGDLNAQLLGTLLITKLQMAALSRANSTPDQRYPFYVYIDEFHTVATDSFASLLSEIRKYGVGLHLTHQYVGQLSDKLKDAIVGNVGTLLALRLGQDDAAWLAPYYQPLTAEDLTNIAAYHFHCKMLRGGTISTPFTVQSFRADRAAEAKVETIIRARMQAAALLMKLGGSDSEPAVLASKSELVQERLLHNQVGS